MGKVVVAVLALAAAFLLGGFAHAETYFSGASVLSMCGTRGDDSAATGKRNLCAFFLTGVSDGVVTSSLYARPAQPLESALCLPDNIAVAELSNTLDAYGKAHPDAVNGGAARLAADAFAARYSCGRPSNRPTKPDVVFFSAGDLVQRCTDENALVGLYCLYYVVGVSDLYAALASEPDAAFAQQICYPRNMADDQPRRTFVAYMQAHPGARGDNAALIVARALHGEFPCRSHSR